MWISDLALCRPWLPAVALRNGPAHLRKRPPSAADAPRFNRRESGPRHGLQPVGQFAEGTLGRGYGTLTQERFGIIGNQTRGYPRFHQECCLPVWFGGVSATFEKGHRSVGLRPSIDLKTCLFATTLFSSMGCVLACDGPSLAGAIIWRLERCLQTLGDVARKGPGKLSGRV